MYSQGFKVFSRSVIFLQLHIPHYHIQAEIIFPIMLESIETPTMIHCYFNSYSSRVSYEKSKITVMNKKICFKCFEMSKQEPNTFIRFVLVHCALSLTEPEFRMKQITHLHAVTPRGYGLGDVDRASGFFYFMYKSIYFPGALCPSKIKLAARNGYTCRIQMPYHVSSQFSRATGNTQVLCHGYWLNRFYTWQNTIPKLFPGKRQKPHFTIYFSLVSKSQSVVSSYI